jgi:hypothetical protein
MSKKFKWTVEIEVDQIWVEDGFNLTEDRLNSMIGYELSYANGNEYKGTIIKAPKQSTIDKVQGK